MRMNQVTLPVINMPDAVQFYLTLGFRQIVDTPHYARFACPDGDSTFSLALVDHFIVNAAVIYFEHDQLDEWVDDLKSKGIRFVEGPEDKRYLWREALLHDPSGNRIKLYQAGENRLNPPWRVDIVA
ncbi:VOC family protein [Aestuariibacter halophilus]|uniref:VOC family protein n=1 Tax=Fluctibacter halophilus TaxID=226011 RepID=A0ABS8G5F4_9ALTE|nr:VOC family protein [Aestuariibacter halophilus]MCC2615748.1 VOC family protein [Aestuariibacter halophilus]